MMEMMETFISRFIFTEEALFTFQSALCNQREYLKNRVPTKNKRDSPMVNLFCDVSQDKVYGSFFFRGNTVTGKTYLYTL